MFLKVLTLCLSIFNFALASDTSSHASDSALDEMTKSTIQYFCTHKGKLTVKSESKVHKVMLYDVVTSTERGVLCSAKSTRAGFSKAGSYLVWISHQNLRQEARNLLEMADIYEVIKCKWDCTPQEFEIALPKILSEPLLVNALPLANFDGQTLSYWLSMVGQNMGAHWRDRARVLEIPSVHDVYSHVMNAAYAMWRRGFVHRDLHVDNILCIPYFTIRIRIMNVQEAVHFSEMGLSAEEFLDLVAADFRMFAYSFGKHVLLPNQIGVPPEALEVIFPAMERFDVEFGELMTYTRAEGSANRMTFLPARIIAIGKLMAPPHVGLPFNREPSDDVFESIARQFHMVEKSVSQRRSARLRSEFPIALMAFGFFMSLSLLLLFNTFCWSNLDPSYVILSSEET